MRRILVLAMAISFISAPAAADVSARYEAIEENIPIDITMTVEVDEAGNVRIQTGTMAAYYLMRGEDVFVVQRGIDGPVVVRLADQMQLQEELMQRMFLGDTPEAEDEWTVEFGEVGTETINGRVGTAYGIVAEAQERAVHPLFVIGRQPELAPLGEAMGRMNASLEETLPGIMAPLARADSRMMEIIASGAPLRISSLSLTDTSYEDIPPERFALPAPPLTIAQMRAQIEPFDAPPNLPAQASR